MMMTFFYNKVSENQCQDVMEEKTGIITTTIISSHYYKAP
jgi:hypothetical protein